MLRDYQQKIEEMTRQLSDYSAKVTKCEDEKSTALVSLEKLKSEKSECINSQASINKEKVQWTLNVSEMSISLGKYYYGICKVTPTYTSVLKAHMAR